MDQELVNLRVLASRVQLFWIDGVLNSAVPHDQPFPLSRTLVPDQVEHPWAALEGRARPPSDAPDTGPITDAFDRCGRLLLMLGEPGSGKTISLLEIARDLNQRFERDPAQPVPVVFNLASWALRRLPLADWLLQELAAKYFIPRDMARGWFASARLVVLLDGLDEVREADRDDCVEAIREFLLSRAVSGLGVTCRVREYQELPARLPLTGAVRLQALSREQVSGFLETSGRPTRAVELLLAESDELRQLARSPLMLSVMLSACEEPGAVPAGEPGGGQGWSGFLFERYVERMLERKRTTGLPFATARMRWWLAWLADRMEHRGQTEFYLEQLEPGWLPRRWQRLAYVAVSRLLGGFALVAGWAFLFVLVGTLDSWTSAGPPDVDTVTASMAGGGVMVLLVGGAVGVLAALLDGLLLEAQVAPVRVIARGTVRRVLLYVLAGWLLVGPAAGTALGGAAVGLLAGLFFGIRGCATSVENDIRPVESLRFSLHDAKAGVAVAFRKWLWCMLALAVLSLPSFWQELTGPGGAEAALAAAGVTLLLFGGSTLPIFLLLGGLFRVLSSRTLESKAVPNQGIRLTARNSLVAGSVMGLGCGGVVCVLALLASVLAIVEALSRGEPGQAAAELVAVLPYGVVGGAAFAPVAMLWFGGFDVIKYYTLRMMLYLGGYTPRSYVRFLDAAADVVVLNRVGGGFRFLHRRLQAHLAAHLPEYAAAAAASRRPGGRPAAGLPALPGAAA